VSRGVSVERGGCGQMGGWEVGWAGGVCGLGFP
jgi:hypothetical protein